jgi:hypothetical protein
MTQGRVPPAWQVWWAIGYGDIIEVLDKIKTGTFDVKVGFWRDNTEVIYSNTTPENPGAADDFEQCLTANAIFMDIR